MIHLQESQWATFLDTFLAVCELKLISSAQQAGATLDGQMENHHRTTPVGKPKVEVAKQSIEWRKSTFHNNNNIKAVFIDWYESVWREGAQFLTHDVQIVTDFLN